MVHIWMVKPYQIVGNPGRFYVGAIAQIAGFSVCAQAAPSPAIPGADR